MCTIPSSGTCRAPAIAAAGTTIEADGLRRTGEQVAGAPILAVGDSFTYGDEVNDGQTWPAQLQLLTGRRVLNAGVSGYGFDQIVLRAEQLAAKYKPAVIVVSFIADDIRRTEMRRLWSADKPYFVIDDGKLVAARRAGAAARRSGQHHDGLAVDLGLQPPVRFHPAPARPAARLVRRPQAGAGAGHRRAPLLPADASAWPRCRSRAAPR